MYRGVSWKRRRRRCYKEEDRDIVIDGGVRGRERREKERANAMEKEGGEEVEERWGEEDVEEGEIDERFEEIGSSRGDARVSSLSLSLCLRWKESGRRRTSDGPPTVPDPIFVTLVRLSVYPRSLARSSPSRDIPRRPCPDVPINNAYNV